MAIPHFLSTGFRFFEHKGVTDVQTIIDDFGTEVLTADNAPKGWYAWTNPSTGVFVSPTYEGKHFQVTLTRATQQKLQMEVRDQGNIVICTRRINCPSANAWTARIFTGPGHVMIDVTMFSAPPEALYAGILDLSPDAQNAHDHYVYGGGARSNLDVADGNNNVHEVYMLDDTVAGHRTRVSQYGSNQNGGSNGSKTLSGARVYRPREMWCQQSGAGGTYGYLHFAGKAYQTLLCPQSLALGARIYVPIDQGVLGEFIVIGGVGSNWTWLLCVRSA
ncbi:MAG: hypothetical protein ABSH28_09785 [Acidobacteriota bacterium]